MSVRMTLPDVVAALEAIGADPVRTRGGGYSCRCAHPDHPDDVPSMTVAPGRSTDVVLHCFVCAPPKGSADRSPWVAAVLERLRAGTPMPPSSGTSKRGSGGGRAHGHPVAAYDYRDATGTLLARKVKYVGDDGRKSYAWSRPYGDGWADGLARTPLGELPLYRLPDLLAASPGAVVLVVEGEKDADAAWSRGWPATSSAGGAKGPLPADLSHLEGRHCIVVADRDDDGTVYAHRWRDALADVAASVRLARGRVETPKSDLSDHLDAGYGLDDLDFGPSPDGSDGSDVSQEPKNGAQVLDDVLAFGRRFVAWPSEAAAIAWAAWVVHAHVVDHLDSTPRLAIVAPEKQSGKTRVLEVTETLVPRPLRAANTTTAVLFRLIGTDQRPTVLLDEADAIWAERGANEELRALLNAGHRRGSDVARMVGEGARMKAERFATFAAVALAGIGDLPDTLMDRSVALRMKRRAPHERVERWRFRQGKAEGEALRERIEAWVETLDALPVPEDLDDISDRVADVWEPLFAVADAAGGPWPVMIRDACRTLSAAAPQDVSLRVRLLHDLRAVWPTGSAFASTHDLLARLSAIDEGPWAADGPFGDRGLTPRKLGHMLGGYGVTSKHSADKSARGYLRHDLEDPWARYLPPQETSKASEASGDAVCRDCGGPLAEADRHAGADVCHACELNEPRRTA